MGRGSSTLTHETGAAILYGSLGSRGRVPDNRVEYPRAGVTEHYDKNGQLFQVKVDIGTNLFVSLQGELVIPEDDSDSAWLNEYHVFVAETGCLVHVQEGLVSRQGAPALETDDGSNYWLEQGQLHRQDGPAYVNLADDESIWYQRGQKHREDGPAVECEGDREWFVNGQRHRDPADGPAIMSDAGSYEYWVKGQRHRDPSEGPAVIGANGYKEYWQNGNPISTEQAR